MSEEKYRTGLKIGSLFDCIGVSPLSAQGWEHIVMMKKQLVILLDIKHLEFYRCTMSGIYFGWYCKKLIEAQFFSMLDIPI